MSHNPSSLSTPLAKARGLGSAKDGTGHWWWQRITAVIIAPLSIWFIYSLITFVASANRGDVRMWFESPFNAFGTLLLLSAVMYHAKLGVQVIVEDYVHGHFSKLFLLITSNILFLGLTLVSWLSILTMHLGY